MAEIRKLDGIDNNGAQSTDPTGSELTQGHLAGYAPSKTSSEGPARFWGFLQAPQGWLSLGRRTSFSYFGEGNFIAETVISWTKREQQSFETATSFSLASEFLSHCMIENSRTKFQVPPHRLSVKAGAAQSD